MNRSVTFIQPLKMIESHMLAEYARFVNQSGDGEKPEHFYHNLPSGGFLWGFINPDACLIFFDDDAENS